ncbi:phage late control D family protein [Haladaptatus sp. DFWS20]|uniref:phage late control D family protein n=1 Tax=Haladaptatus sp. DFWS20 TaxID=3403467 RepID=UPI003EB87F25
MTLQQLQERYGDFYSPRFRAEIGGQTFTEAHGVLSDVSVDTTMEGADRFSFTLNYPFDYSTGSFSGFEWDDFEVGTSVRLWLGYGKQLEPSPNVERPEADPAFVGKISSVQPSFPSGGTPTIAVSGYDLLHEMTKGTNSGSWEKTKVSDVVTAVASKYFGNNVEVDSTDLKPNKIIQDTKSDYQFLAEELGAKYGFETFVRRETFYFKTREPNKRPSTPVVSLRYGESLSSFSPELNDAEQVKTVEARYWDAAKKKDVVTTVEQSEGTGKRVLRVKTQSVDEARTVAEAEMARISQSFVRGTAETFGIPDIRAGVSVRIEGVDEKFSGDYFVEQATHQIGSSGYTTAFQLTERPK